MIGKGTDLKVSFYQKHKCPLKRRLYGNNMNIIRENLELFDDACKEVNLFYWLGEGTALGAIREQNIIKYDTDADVGIWYTDLDKFVNECLPILRKKGFQLLRFYKKERSCILSVSKNLEYIDIDFTGPGRLCYANYGGECDKLIPYLQTFNKGYIGDREYNVPQVGYLVELYGKDWRIPKRK